MQINLGKEEEKKEEPSHYKLSNAEHMEQLQKKREESKENSKMGSKIASEQHEQQNANAMEPGTEEKKSEDLIKDEKEEKEEEKEPEIEEGMKVGKEIEAERESLGINSNRNQSAIGIDNTIPGQQLSREQLEDKKKKLYPTIAIAYHNLGVEKEYLKNFQAAVNCYEKGYIQIYLCL